jgi:hypothetical protein
MKQTLLDLVQNILSSLDSDEVNSISDTTESLQIATIVKNTYFNILARTTTKRDTDLFQLDSSADVLTPVLMHKPEHVEKIEWVKYYDTVDSDYKYVTIIPIEQFLDKVNQLNLTDTNTEEFAFEANGVSFNLLYKDDSPPQFCTVVQNHYVIFDSYDKSVDSTLQSSKTLCIGEITPTFLMEDTFIPDLDEQQFPLLLNESKSLAFFELKQTLHQKAEQESKRQWSVFMKKQSVVDTPNDFDQLPYFGRR